MHFVHTCSLTTNFVKAEEKIVGLEQQMDQLHEESSTTVESLQRELEEKTSQLNQLSDSHASHEEDSETDLRSTVHSLSARCDHLRDR